MSTIEDPRPDGEPEAAAAGDAPGPPARPPRQPSRYGRAAKFVAPVVAALLVGGGVGFALNHDSGSNASAGDSPAAVGGGQRFGGPGGGIAGEQRIQGTITAKTSSSVTVKSSSGTATYAVSVTSQIVRNGQPASLSAIKVGDPVLVHVYPSSSGKMLVERLFAGSLPNGAPGFGPPRSGAPGTQSSSSST